MKRVTIRLETAVVLSVPGEIPTNLNEYVEYLVSTSLAPTLCSSMPGSVVDEHHATVSIEEDLLDELTRLGQEMGDYDGE